MLQRLRALQKNGADSGFTLIELLIVIVILGVLSGIVVFAVSAFNNDGKAAACKSDAKNVEVAAEAFYAKMHYAAPSQQALVDAGYLKEVPSSPDYVITLSGGLVSAKGACTITGTGPTQNPSPATP